MNTLVLLKTRFCFPYLSDCEFLNYASSVSLDSVYSLMFVDTLMQARHSVAGIDHSGAKLVSIREAAECGNAETSVIFCSQLFGYRQNRWFLKNGIQNM